MCSLPFVLLLLALCGTGLALLVMKVLQQLNGFPLFLCCPTRLVLFNGGQSKPERSHHSRDSGRCGLPISCWAIDLLIWHSRKLNPRRTLPDANIGAAVFAYYASPCVAQQPGS